MYLPAQFQEPDPSAMQALIRDCPLGLLISGGGSDLLANPIPILFDPSAGAKGVLRCHVARANAQWKAIGSGAEVLAVFQGSQHYVHPGWYETKAATGKVVPTWNYVMVQVRGRAAITEDGAWLGRQIRDLTAMMEGRYPDPWSVEDAPAAFIEAQIRGIVEIEIAITSMTGKWKVSQNRSEADRHGVVAGLQSRPGDDAAAMARLVAEKLRTARDP